VSVCVCHMLNVVNSLWISSRLLIFPFIIQAEKRNSHALPSALMLLMRRKERKIRNESTITERVVTLANNKHDTAKCQREQRVSKAHNRHIDFHQAKLSNLNSKKSTLFSLLLSVDSVWWTSFVLYTVFHSLVFILTNAFLTCYSSFSIRTKEDKHRRRSSRHN
jgi:hypothetical protein